jgi:hypothetical protein
MGHGGAPMCQVCKDSQPTRAFPMKSEHEIPGILEDFIRGDGAPTGLMMSDNAKVQTGKEVLEILRMYSIDASQSEPEHQNQNYAERRIQEIKKLF